MKETLIFLLGNKEHYPSNYKTTNHLKMQRKTIQTETESIEKVYK
jgi:hypothetical protein